MIRRCAKVFFVLAVAFQLGVSTHTAHASSITYSASSSTMSASALFDLKGDLLTITLSNLSTSDVLIPSDVLTGVFFNTEHALTPLSASLGGSSVYYGALSDVGDGWGYATGVSAQGYNSAISASGAVAGLGFSNFSSTANKLQGLDYGLLSLGDNTDTGNKGGVKKKGPLIKDSVIFTLTAYQGFSLSELGDTVVFQYGTALSEPHITGFDPPSATNPEPASMLLMGLGVAGAALARGRLRKQ